MGFLAGKRLLITGRAEQPLHRLWHRQACHREGAELAFSYVGERFKERITEFAAEFGSNADLRLRRRRRRADRPRCSPTWARPGPQFDGFVHAIGFAPREAIAGDFLDGLTRENFRIAHDISAYSFPAMAKAALPQLRPGASLLTLTYLGAMRYVPNYNTMGLAKAVAGSQRALPGRTAWARKGIRVNGISAGPIKTLAASGIKDFGKLLAEFAADHADRAATSRSTTWATSPPSCCPTWPPASAPRSPTWTAASASAMAVRA